MCVFKSFFSQKRFWGSLLGIIIVVMIFSIAFIGSIVNPTPKDLPVALVVNDKAAKLPNNTKLNAGEQYKEALLDNKDIPFKWSVIDTREDAISAMNEPIGIVGFGKVCSSSALRPPNRGWRHVPGSVAARNSRSIRSGFHLQYAQHREWSCAPGKGAT